jgi:hypothetical protein
VIFEEGRPLECPHGLHFLRWVCRLCDGSGDGIKIGTSDDVPIDHLILDRFKLAPCINDERGITLASETVQFFHQTINSRFQFAKNSFV